MPSSTLTKPEPLLPKPLFLVRPEPAPASSLLESIWVERAFLVFLGAVAIGMLYFSSVKLLSFDELLSYYTESVPTTAALLRVQSSVPVSLDPPLYHLLGHWALALGNNPAIGVRLPSLIGSILMMGCVYFFTRRLAGRYVAAMAVGGLIISNAFHMVEARPYGILLGATGVSLLLWQNVIRGKHRLPSLLGLFLALALATSCHYFGILVAVPFLVVECVRIYTRRTLDLPLTAVLVASYLPVAAWLPFLKAAHTYKSAYYAKVQLPDLYWAYTLPLDSALSIRSHLTDALLALAIVTMIAAGTYLGYQRSAARQRHPEEWLLVLVLALLPVFGMALAVAASGAFESRYVLGFSIGLAIALSSLAAYAIQSRLARTLIVIACSLLIAAKLIRSIAENRGQKSALALCAAQVSSGQRVVMTDDDEFLRLHHYYPDSPAGGADAVWVADKRHEIAFAGTDNIDRTMLNLADFAGLPVTTYDELTHKYPEFDMIQSSVTTPPDWVPKQLQLDKADFLLTRKAGNDSIYHVRLPSSER